MDIVIDIDAIEDASKKKWLMNTLELMGIAFKTVEKAQTIEEYNNELQEEEIEIEKGNFTSNEELKKESKSW